MSRPPEKQLATAVWLLAQFKHQIAEFEDTGAHADQIDALREGRATWEQRVKDLGGTVPE